MYETWSVPKGGHEDNSFVIRLEYGYQPYKEEMHSRGSGSMKMNDEEIKKYTEAISKNSDNLFVCPRCEDHTDKLKANIKTHLRRKNPCMRSSSSSVVHHNVQVTNDHSTHTSNHDHSIHNTHNTTINNANITIQLQPINCSNPEEERRRNILHVSARQHVRSHAAGPNDPASYHQFATIMFVCGHLRHNAQSIIGHINLDIIMFINSRCQNDCPAA